MILGKVRNYIGCFRAYNKERRQVRNAGIYQKEDRLAGRIVRFVHSIEKGLSIESPRAEFGYEKILTLKGWISEYMALLPSDKTCVYMVADALAAYCEYHDSIGVNTEKINTVRCIAESLKKIKDEDKAEGIYGGTLTINREDQVFDKDFVEKLFKTRHSIRQFDKTPVSDELIQKAVELAQTAPSACNRQAVRVYAMDTERFVDAYPGNLQGVGGFVDSCDKVLLITGKIAPYESYEYKQFIVSASIFAGYLSLSLHALGLGACIVQRSLAPSDDWNEFSEKMNIPTDEQIVCLVVVGNMKETTVVPYSKRFSTKTILKFL